MIYPPGSAWRGSLLVVLVACSVTLALGGCGRRGQPEAPNAPTTTTTQAAGSGELAPSRASRTTSPQTATQNTPDDESDDEDQFAPKVSPQPNISRRRGTPYIKPKEPFILDFLL